MALESLSVGVPAFEKAYVDALLEEDHEGTLLGALAPSRRCLSPHLIEALRQNPSNLRAKSYPLPGQRSAPLGVNFCIAWKRFDTSGAGHLAGNLPSARRPSLVQVLPHVIPGDQRAAIEYAFRFEHRCWLDWWTKHRNTSRQMARGRHHVAREIVPPEVAVVFGQLAIETPEAGMQPLYFLQRPLLEWPTFRDWTFDDARKEQLWRELANTVKGVFDPMHVGLTGELTEALNPGPLPPNPTRNVFLDRLLSDGTNVVCTVWRDWAAHFRPVTGLADVDLFPPQ